MSAFDVAQYVRKLDAVACELAWLWTRWLSIAIEHPGLERDVR